MTLSPTIDPMALVTTPTRLVKTVLQPYKVVTSQLYVVYTVGLTVI